MADLNEPKKETVRITLPPRPPQRPTVPVEKEAARINLPKPPSAASPTGARPPAPLFRPTSPLPVRPPPPPSVAPKPIPPADAIAAPKPPASPPAPSSSPSPPSSPPPLTSPAAPAPPGVIKPPGAAPLPPAGLKPSTLPRSPGAPARSPLTSAAFKPGLMPAKPERENPPTPGGPRKDTARIALTPEPPMKATVKLSGPQPSNGPPISVIRTAPPALVKPPASSLGETIPTQFCWALLAISALALLVQLWIYFS